MQTELLNEAQMVLIQFAKKHASDYSEKLLKSNKGLAASLARKTMIVAKHERPDIDTETWAKAAEKLALM